MNNRVFSLDRDGVLRRLERQTYTNEQILQRLLAQYPDLLAGDEMDLEAPKRWLFIGREYGVPGEEGGSSRWALDHLFIDQDAVPTLVEVKLSTDTRIRREVVGQMLDYAANGVTYWPVEKLREQFETTCAQKGDDPTEVVARRANGGQADVEQFWTQVKTNLQAGRIRLVFVADEIPPELRRVIEFLNSQMDPAEVLAVEVKQFVGEHHNTLVPTVIGRTAAARLKKGTTRESGERWTPERFFAYLLQQRGGEEVAAAQDLLAWATPRFTRIWWGSGKTYASYVPILELNGGRSRGGHNAMIFSVFANGYVELQFETLKAIPGFTDETVRRELTERLNALPDVRIPPDAINRRPSFRLSVLTSPAALENFKAVILWAMNLVKGVVSEEQS